MFRKKQSNFYFLQNMKQTTHAKNNANIFLRYLYLKLYAFLRFLCVYLIVFAHQYKYMSLKLMYYKINTVIEFDVLQDILIGQYLESLLGLYCTDNSSNNQHYLTIKCMNNIFW